MRKYSSFIAAAAGAAVLTMTAYALAFGGHGGRHHGSPALMACMVAAPKSVKKDLWSTLKSSSLRADREAAEAAKEKLEEAILAKNTSLGKYETAASQAQLKMLQDEDAIATNVCGQLSQDQLTAASTLYTNLQNERQTVRGYFKTAHAAGE